MAQFLSLPEAMFPAPAGMNRVIFSIQTSLTDVPRTRGDEPHFLHMRHNIRVCSPHPRG